MFIEIREKRTVNRYGENEMGIGLRSIVPIAGGVYYDSFNFLFAMLIISDVVLDFLPFTHNFTETVIMKLRKRDG